MKKKNSEIQTLLLILIVVIGIFNVLIGAIIINDTNNRAAETEEAARPAQLELTRITTDCTDCFDIETVINEIKSQNVNITENSLDYSSEEANNLIRLYGIKKLPSFILKGEINKTANLESALNKYGIVVEGVFVFTRAVPPYIDFFSNEVKGRVAVTKIIDGSCGNCTDISGIINQLKGSGISIASENSVDYLSAEGKELIDKYNIEKVPAAILSSDLGEYNNLVVSWNNFGTAENDGNYILRNINPPFRNLTTNKIKGLVELISIIDETCTECYNVSVHEPILYGFGIVISDKKTYDISSAKGREFIEKYNISDVPTIILSNEADVYNIFKSVWSDVGTKESDGWFVFRNIGVFGGQKYKNLVNNTIETA